MYMRFYVCYSAFHKTIKSAHEQTRGLINESRKKTYQDELVDYDVKIVFVAHGVRFITDDRLTDTPFAEDEKLAERRMSLKNRLMSLHDVQGVGLELCNITRSQINLANDKLYDGVVMVPSGVVRIAELQRQGYAYIKVE